MASVKHISFQVTSSLKFLRHSFTCNQCFHSPSADQKIPIDFNLFEALIRPFQKGSPIVHRSVLPESRSLNAFQRCEQRPARRRKEEGEIRAKGFFWPVEHTS